MGYNEIKKKKKLFPLSYELEFSRGNVLFLVVLGLLPRGQVGFILSKQLGAQGLFILKLPN